MKVIKNISILVFLFASSITYTQVKFEAIVSKDTLVVNEIFRVDFEVDKEVDSFAAPNFKDFKIVRGPNVTISNSWVAGERSYKKTHTYYIKPMKVGTLIVDKAIAIKDEVTYSTNPLAVEVAEQDSLSSIKLKEKSFKEDLYLRCEYLSDRVSLKDSLTLTYKIYVSSRFGVKSWTIIEDSQISNAIAEEIKLDALKIENKDIDGKNFRYVVLKEVSIKPLDKDKKISISPMQIDVIAEIPTVKEDIFGNKIFREEGITLSTEQITIDVD